MLREELAPKGFEVVTVALDSGGAERPRSYHEIAGTTHPALIDESHLLDALLGIVNVPQAVWIDEDGMLVRPPEAAAPQSMEEQLPNITVSRWHARPRLADARGGREDPDLLGALHPGASRLGGEGQADSQYALTPEQVVAKSQPRSADEAQAAASFELGDHLYRNGETEAAVHWFREAHRLQPDNWTYRRQAWFFADPLRIGPTEGAEDDWPYEGDWLTDARKVGAENYYDPPDL